MADDLAVLFSEITVEAKGEQIKLRPFGFGQLARVAKLVRPIAQALISAGLLTITQNSDNTSTVNLDRNFIPKVFQLLDDGLEPLMLLIAYTIGKPRDWLDTLPPDEGLLLAQKVYDLNADFFVKRVMPHLGKMFSSFVSTGVTSSPGSSEQDTGAQTSTSTLSDK